MNIAKWLSLNGKRQERIRELLVRRGNRHVTNNDIGNWALSVAYQAIDAALHAAKDNEEVYAFTEWEMTLYCQQCSEQLQWPEDLYEKVQVYHNQSGIIAAVTLRAFCPRCGRVYIGYVSVDKSPDWMLEGRDEIIPQSEMERSTRSLPGN